MGIGVLINGSKCRTTNADIHEDHSNRLSAFFAAAIVNYLRGECVAGRSPLRESYDNSKRRWQDEMTACDARIGHLFDEVTIKQLFRSSSLKMAT